MSEPIVEVRGLRKHYGAYEAVAAIDLEVRRGEIFAFLGPNGACPFAYARRIWTTPAARSTSPHSSANSSDGLSPVAAANTTIGPNRGPSRSATDRICAQESNGRCSRQRRPGFGTPRLAGFSSISFQATARFSTCRSACVASKPVVATYGAPDDASQG